jgi:phosphatidylinositol alpha-mannosyltransferase
MRRLDARIAVSDAARRTIAEHFPGDYTVVPNAIDLTRFEPPAERPPEMTAGRPSVLFVGRLEPRKGVACLIDAMAMVQRRFPACRLIIVGDGPERRTLEQLARHAAVDVSWVGAVSDEMLPAYYGAADVFCSPAVGDESFGLVLLEAMAARRPIVASRIQGYAELLGTAECAQLVEPGNPAALADAICGLLRDPDLRRTMGLRAASFAEAYDWNAIARRLEAIYIGILSRYAPARALA